jgi:signal transduction histidine kinase
MGLTVFRTMQKSLTNIQRHSGSTKASVRLPSDEVHVGVRDYGKGNARLEARWLILGTREDEYRNRESVRPV